MLWWFHENIKMAQIDTLPDGTMVERPLCGVWRNCSTRFPLDVRGRLNTRLSNLWMPVSTAIILAVAGLQRLSDRIIKFQLKFLHAVGQRPESNAALMIRKCCHCWAIERMFNAQSAL